jgi:hypothetical protein
MGQVHISNKEHLRVLDFYTNAIMKVVRTSMSSTAGRQGVRIVSVIGGDLEMLSWTHNTWDWECTVERRVGLRQLTNI